MMAVCGRSSVFVGQRPTVAILSTGDEIVDLDGDLTGPCIYNSNGYMLAAQIRSAGGVPHYMENPATPSPFDSLTGTMT